MRYNIRAYHGGLGDQLQFSTFPEYLTKLGHEVYLYDGPDVLPMRNPGIRELVWDKNPFIKGISKDNWNFGDLPGVAYRNTQGAFIANWEAALQLPLSGDLGLPKIYYEPKVEKLGQLKHCKFGGIIELSSIHHKYDANTLIASVAQLMIDRSDVEWCQIVSPGQSNPILIPAIPQIHVGSIFELADTIANCKIFVSSLSGQHSLAASIQRINPHFEQYCLIPKNDYQGVMDSKKFVFPNVEYFPT